MYCVYDENAHLKGTMNDRVYNEDHSYLIYEIHRCHEAIRNTTQIDPDCMSNCTTVDPPCASSSEIDEYTQYKKAMFRVIDTKVDYSNFAVSVRNKEKFLPSIPLSKGSYSDTGYRFRKNIFNRNDDWVHGYNEIQDTFYDFNVFNSDTLNIGPKSNILAEMYFRIETDQI